MALTLTNPLAVITIATSTTVSAAVDLNGNILVAVITPATLTGTAMTFQSSNDGTTYNSVVKEDGSAYSITVAASKHTKVDSTVFLGCRFLKVVSGSAEAADRTITLCCQPLRNYP